MSDPYIDPRTGLLRNKLGIGDAAALEMFERLIVQQRIEEGCPEGRFDLAHLRAIHRHLFQDIYDWAGQLSTVEISKGGTQFMPRRYIETGMAEVHRRIEEVEYLRGLSIAAFAAKAGEIVGDVNHAHPFREGNGHTQIEYLRQLAEQAGHRFAPEWLPPKRWIAASQAAHYGDYRPMAVEIQMGLEGG